jgi:serine/threonine protein kinase
MIHFACPSCRKKLGVKEDLAGKKGKCPGCGKAILVPSTNGSLASALGATDPDARTLMPAPPLLTQVAVGVRAGEHAAELTEFLAPAEAPDELGRLGGFRILKILGQGGMGVVFQGEDPRLGRKVAIKAMLPHLAASKSAQQRFLREARTAANLEHENIVPILQVGEERGVPFIAMPFLKGEALDERLRRENVLRVAEILRIGRQTASGLQAAHEAGLIHRDIKPANIWLEGSAGEPGASATGVLPDEPGASATGGRVKILDFGLARETSDTSQLTQQGAIIGTPAYMAPEQATGESVDHRCDLFSLGCVLYRLCTGQLPFKGKDTVSTLLAVATENPAPPAEVRPDLPEPLSDLVMQMLAKKAEDRPATARAVVQALSSIETQAGDGTIRLESEPLIRTTGDWTRKRPRRSEPNHLPLVWLAGGGVACLGLLALVAFLLLRSDTAVPDRSRQTKQEVAPNGERSSRKEDTPKREISSVEKEPKRESQPTEKNPPLVKRPETPPPSFTNSLGMQFMLVPKGTSWLGDSGRKPGGSETEMRYDFYLGKYEVTQEEWEKVMGTSPSHFSREGRGKQTVKDVLDRDLRQFPVEKVSFEDAKQFLSRLNARDKQAGWVYRLPSEKEWEYACRGGPMANKDNSLFDYYFAGPSRILPADQANYRRTLNRTCPVGSYAPNRLGLHDMHGNVAEWCQDGSGPHHHLVRGGSWRNDAGLCRATARTPVGNNDRHDDLGLRVARVPVETKGK